MYIHVHVCRFTPTTTDKTQYNWGYASSIKTPLLFAVVSIIHNSGTHEVPPVSKLDQYHSITQEGLKLQSPHGVVLWHAVHLVRMSCWYTGMGTPLFKRGLFTVQKPLNHKSLTYHNNTHHVSRVTAQQQV